MANDTTTTAETKGGADDKDSILTKIRLNWIKAGKKKLTEDQVKKLTKNYKEASDKSEAAENALNAAKLIEDEAILALAQAFGGNSLKIGGVVHEFACRKGRVFFRKRASDIIEIDG